MSLYDDKTHDSILEDMRDEAPDSADNYEGTLAYNNMSAAAYEIEKVYQQLAYLHSERDPATASFEGLSEIVRDRGLYPKQPSAAIGLAKFNVAVPIGSKFTIGAFTYDVTALKDDASHTYVVTCETTGSTPNTVIGTLTAVDSIEGLTSAELIEITTLGEDLETRDHLYQRWQDSFSADYFAGNVAAYKTAINAQQGIGGCKVWPAWKGGSTILAVLISSDYGPVSDTECEKLLKYFCPEKYAGKGWCPIGADLTVQSAESVAINLSITATYTAGNDFVSAKSEIESSVDGFLLDLRQKWSSGDEKTKTTIYSSRLLAKLLEIDKIVDISEIKINGNSGNLSLEYNQIPIRGEING